ncbi:MAG: M23 family metallopeptidase [Candidatus Azobacteroides sp.]|nr:M23 family metallopeptidase [Candidatus Azobacteroides sp.]
MRLWIVSVLMGGVFFLFFTRAVQAQSMASPMDIPLLLSGNFGELRNNHFHSGLDIKTQGVAGIPVVAVKDGYVSRVSVSSTGYGNALYVAHPDGTTSVYGHLDKFAPFIETEVRNAQYQNESFAIDILFLPDDLPVKRGERIAWSGNTGASGGPHLHFEIRDTENDKAMDPLSYLKNRIQDTRPPEIRGLMFFPQFGKGVVNGSIQNLPIALIKNKAGKIRLTQAISAWGSIGVGIKAYDRMDGTSNLYGIYEIILKVDGKEVYHSIMDQFSIEDTRYLNTYIDWKEWTENRSFYMKSFTDPGNRLGINRSLSNGIIDIEEERAYHLEYILKDIYQNTATLSFDITGKKMDIPPYKRNEAFFPFNKDNEYNQKGIDLILPRGNLYTNLYLQIDTLSGGTPYAPLYRIGEWLPLHSYCPLTLDISNDQYPNKSKYGVVQLRKDKNVWLGGEYEKGRIKTRIRELGSFCIEIDTIPPVITPLNEAKWGINRRIAFRITDELSGIASYKGTLNNRFALFEYDAKRQLLYYVYDFDRISKGNQNLELNVTDGAGNTTKFVSNLWIE